MIIEQMRNLVKADWTPAVVESAYDSNALGHTGRARAKLVILGSVASLKDAVTHLALAVVNATRSFNFTFQSSKADFVVDKRGKVIIVQFLRGQAKEKAFQHVQKAKMFALNFFSTIFRGLVSPQSQMAYLNSNMPFALSDKVKIALNAKNAPKDEN